MNDKGIKKIFFLLLLISFAVRLFMAATLELGNDEVYYWTYAMFPALSHFDHPPMVGFFIQLFTLNLTFQHELFIRLASVVFGTINMYLIFLIATKIKNERTGLYAAILHTSSIYCFILTGIFILPDTPQNFFWLVSLYFLVHALPDEEPTGKSKRYFIFAGITIGLAMLSKYHSIFLWGGTILYILFYNRQWLKTKELYLSMVLSILLFIPVIIWNIENHFISFNFQSNRVGLWSSHLRMDYFMEELGGEFLYSNPVNFVLIIISLSAFWVKRKIFLERKYMRFLLLFGLPVILVFLIISFFKQTLPHWTGPGYLTMMMLAACYLDETIKNKKNVLPLSLKLSLSLLLLIITIGFVQIQFGLIPIKKDTLTVEMYGWKKFNHKFQQIIKQDQDQFKMSADAPVITTKWFNAAHLDYYVAKPNRKKLYALGSLDNLHKYAWINIQRGNIPRDSDAYYIVPDFYFRDPAEFSTQYFESIQPPDTVKIYRNKKCISNFYIYRLKKFIGNTDFILK